MVKWSKVIENGIEYDVKEGSYGKYWYQNGKFHRIDGPSIEYNSGSKHWYQNGKRHRIDGPAIEWCYGSKSYYIKGKFYDENEYWEHPLVKNELRIKKLKRILNGKM